MKNLNELAQKMCLCENDGIGVVVDGYIYFYENFGDEDPIERIYRHFGTNRQMTFYSMTWAHQYQIKYFMELYNEYGKREEDAKIIAEYIAGWSGCTFAEALKQVESQKIRYSKIA